MQTVYYLFILLWNIVIAAYNKTNKNGLKLEPQHVYIAAFYTNIADIADISLKVELQGRAIKQRVQFIPRLYNSHCSERVTLCS